jgi:hypothetical protein
MDDVIQNCFFNVTDQRLLLAALTRALGSPFSTSVSICLKQILAAVEATRTIRELNVLISPPKDGWIALIPREEQLTEKTLRELSEDLGMKTVSVTRTGNDCQYRVDVFASGLVQRKVDEVSSNSSVDDELRAEGVPWPLAPYGGSFGGEWTRKRYRLL